ncbi:MAG TPA: hypothetical protein VMC86_10110 [Gemmatimonadales bacterium]|nr:hypothetical protein [Gemmatimonadales bacterium]
MAVDQERGWLMATAEGSITLEDVRVHLSHEARAASLPYPELIDARAARPDLSPDDVRAIVVLLRELARDSRLGPTAVIVETDVGYGMLRMLEMLVEDVCAIRPFRRREPAEEWLSELSPR